MAHIGHYQLWRTFMAHIQWCIVQTQEGCFVFVVLLFCLLVPYETDKVDRES